jgi:hypothetical protein
MVSNLDVNIPGIVKGWKHKTGDTINKKIDLLDIVSLEVNVLVLGIELGLQQGTEPGDEGRAPILEELQLLVPFLVDVQGHFHLQLMGQVLQKRIHFMQVCFLFVIYRL